MTVRELIAALSEFEPDLPVGYFDSGWGWEPVDYMNMDDPESEVRRS